MRTLKTTMEMEDQPQGRATDLGELAQTKFGKDTLSHAENLLLEKVPTGEWAVCGPNRDEKSTNNPYDADNWGREREIRAALIVWLCVDQEARKHVHWRGIQVYGADVAGPLDLSFVSIPFQLAFEHCRLKGSINLSQAEVLQLDLQGSLVCGITADSLTVKNNLLLNAHFESRGEVRLLGAQIGGDLDCSEGTFINPPRNGPFRSGGVALNADRINVKGSVFLSNDFSAEGNVVLLRAQIGGDLFCDGGKFLNPHTGNLVTSGKALKADRINVKGDVFLSDGFAADGEVYLRGAQIGGAFVCRNGNFAKATLDLRDASAASLWDSGLNEPGSVADYSPRIWPEADYSPTIWPEQRKLFLDGFAYGRISSVGRINVNKRLEWLGLQPSPPFRQQPYLHMAKVLRDSGDSDGALRVLMRMEELRRSDEGHRPFARLWSSLLRWSVGYGYRPGRAVRLIFLLSLLGWLVYHRSYYAGTMLPTEDKAYDKFVESGCGRRVPPNYPTFSPLIYSLENSLPLVKLGQADKWRPGRRLEGTSPTSFLSCFATSPDLVTWFLRIQIMLGWLLATLFLAGVSGIVHKE